MANPEHLAIIKQGVKVWNKWREENPDIKPDLKNINLKNKNFKEINFSRTDLRGANFNNTILIKANFSHARFGLNYELFWFVLLTVIIFGIYFFRIYLINVCFIYSVSLFYSILSCIFTFLANRPYLPQHEKLVSKSESNLWKYHQNSSYVLKYDELIQNITTNIIHLIYWSFFNFIPLFYFLAWLEPKLRLFADNEPVNLLIFSCTLIATFYMSLSGLGLNIDYFSRKIFFFLIPTTRFINADLTDANFSFAYLSHVDFIKATIIRTNWNKVQGIRQISINVKEPYILKPLILNLILHRQAKKQDLGKINLSGLNISKTDFEKSQLVSTDLSNSDLSSSIFVNANLTKAQLSGANLTGANLTGACIEDWKINSQTNLSNVVCDYVYLKQRQKERRPHSGKFKPGEFTKRYQKILETVDLYFDDGIDWKIFLQSFNKLRDEAKLKIQSGKYQLPVVQTIENKNNGSFLIRVGVSPDINKEEWEKSFWSKYNPLLEAKEQTITILSTELKSRRKENIELYGILQTMAAKQSKSLNDKQIQILQAIRNGIRSQRDIAQILNIENDTVKYYLEIFEQNKFIEGHKEFVMTSELEYLDCRLTTKGKVAANNPDDLIDESITMETRNIHTKNYNERIEQYGSGDNIAGDKKITYKNQNPELDTIIAEIQSILKKQEEEFNPNKDLGQKRIANAAIQEIDNNSNLTKRILSASEKGLITYLHSKFISPVQSAFLAVLEDWYKTKTKK